MESREERKKRITQERQDQILSAALDVFSRNGFAGSTIPDIAREADIAVGTIYNYYQNKRDLLVAIVKRYIVESFTGIMDKLSTEDEATYITGVVENRLNVGLENAGTFLPIFSEIQRDSELRQTFTRRVLQPTMGIIENYVTSRVNEGVFREVDPAVVTRAVAGMVIGFMFIYRMEGEKSPVHETDRKKLAGELAGLILKGLQKK